jgi:hypothetical protein
MTLFYILNEAGQPVPEPDVLAWGNWYHARGHHVAEDVIGDIRVSTIFKGVDNSYREGPPRGLFETAIFAPDHYEVGMFDTREIAQVGHSLAVRAAKRFVEEGMPATRLSTWICDASTPNDFYEGLCQRMIDAGTPPATARVKARYMTVGHSDVRELGPAGVVVIAQRQRTYVILAGLSLSGHKRRWHYGTYAEAKAALDAWDGTGEPAGWLPYPRPKRGLQ